MSALAEFEVMVFPVDPQVGTAVGEIRLQVGAVRFVLTITTSDAVQPLMVLVTVTV
jgi:hypothetical protein